MLYGPKDRPAFGKWLVLALQHVFAMFGATVLVPILTGLDVGVGLVASGIGTLIYILCTKGKVPIYLGSSFAYIGAIITASAAGGYGSAYVGLIAVGLIYVAVSIVLHFTGTGWLKKLLAPVIVGPMIIIIGLSLAPVAIGQAGFNGTTDWHIPVVAIITLVTVVITSLKAKGFLKVIPFLVAVVIGYVFSAMFGLVNWDIFSNVPFLQVPNFTFIGTYALDFSAVLMFAPIAFVTIAEHIGDHTVIGEITGNDFLADPGLDKTLLGDGIATGVAAMMGGPANTSYSENVGVVGITKVASVWVTGLAAVIAILLGFVGWIQAFVMSIPVAVLGGMSIILFGLIAANGVHVMRKANVNLGSMRTIIIVAVMLVLGLGGAAITIGTASIGGMSLAVIAGILLNTFLPEE
jgi:uracil permease